jgi:uncharacterized protein YndB with AHSA1/START domain
MTPEPVPADSPGGYACRLTIQAPRERVFDVIATVDGPRHWWTPEVTGSADAGGELRFSFAGPAGPAGQAEQMIMLVRASQRPATVRWSCVAHSRDEEWTGTELEFQLEERGPRACELDFRHAGLPAGVVAAGWERFLASLAACAEGRTGTPFRG